LKINSTTPVALHIDYGTNKRSLTKQLNYELQYVSSVKCESETVESKTKNCVLDIHCIYKW